MTRWILAAIAALGVSLLSPGAAFAYQGGQLKNHSHSSQPGQGGGTLSPTTLTATTLRSNSGTQKFSSGTFTVDGVGSAINLSNAGSITLPSTFSVVTSTYMVGFTASVTNTVLGVCQATITYTASSCFSNGLVASNINYTDDGNNRTACMTMLINGRYIQPFDSATPMRCWNGFVSSTNIPQPLNVVFPIPGPQIPCSGTVSLCISLTTSNAAAALVIPARPALGTAFSDKASWGISLIR